MKSNAMKIKGVDLRVGSPEPLWAGAVQPDEAPALAGNHLPTAAA